MVWRGRPLARDASRRRDDRRGLRQPQIGVASSWNEITPCNLSLARLAEAVKRRSAAGGYPLEFGTISVSDGITMGHQGMHFSLVSPRGHRRLRRDGHDGRRLDGRSCSPAATRTCPAADGHGPARPRQRLPLRRHDHARLASKARTSTSSNLRGRRRLPAPARSRDEVDKIERAICPGDGACGGMYTANTMASSPRRWACRCPARPHRRPSTADATDSRTSPGEAVVELLARASPPARS